MQETNIFIEVDVHFFPIIVLETASDCKVENSDERSLEILAIEVSVKICELNVKSVNCLLDYILILVARDC